MIGDEALALAEAGSHGLTLVNALTIASTTHLIVGNITDTLRLGQRATALAKEQGLKHNAAQSLAIVLQGRTEEGIRELREGLAAERAFGDRWGSDRGQVLLAEALDCVGSYDEGLGVLDEFIATAVAGGVRDFLAEAHRLRARLLLKLAEPG